MAGYAETAVVPDVVRWVESSGGPLIALPEAVLPFWAGADGDETSSDYDRACDIDGYVGLLPVGDTRALVLGHEPASTAYLPEHGTFVRWYAADSEAELLADVPAALDAAAWEPEVRWRVPGPAVLFDAVWPGDAFRDTDHVRVELAPGHYGVRAARVVTGPETWLGLVQVRSLTH
ncbi:immunity 21 family protein [Streptomyces europaeiscabiei]|uniref:Immunity 21 family protein n=1 Tax=Streptomyces europaeiscabiei TaxID=146819 RepID=A0ABU4NM75_9ACTN|nr:immunity 21 family protein [Streptomyces europaeiscabiei]MDX2529270.1 immunity 21 family protein [Streptomyces europaeiscabiei]MDX3546423.1 immunity 21 family protein [Streptomyces europaeiscabiei]MDX3556117.1 immunity 21 family protein [Streptomyces europaeiscabiei]MDX3703913.1 immunity 21 family protein [Streptomyces europaeiscabiei]MDX3712050.1 immunity 21 family protein [Streptomyces europaeiscabiei]